MSTEPVPTRDRRRAILLYEATEGGAGVLGRLTSDAAALSQVARKALELMHFDNMQLQSPRRLRISPKSRTPAASLVAIAARYSRNATGNRYRGSAARPRRRRAICRGQQPTRDHFGAGRRRLVDGEAHGSSHVPRGEPFRNRRRQRRNVGAHCAASACRAVLAAGQGPDRDPSRSTAPPS